MRRVPNFGHFLIFAALTVILLVVAQAVVLGLGGGLGRPDKMLAAVQDQRSQLAVMGIAYVGTLGISWGLFPAIWHRPLLKGLRWNAGRVRWPLIGVGLGLGLLVQLSEGLITMPKTIPMDQFFKSAGVVWALTFFGTVLGPIYEEIAFRGFLFPALAIGYDWLLVPRTPEGAEAWRESAGLSRPAILFGGILSSAIFALVHAAQLGYTWGAVALLMGVSLALTAVRWRTGSVAASTVVHACYNLSVFVTLLIATGGYRHLERMGR